MVALANCEKHELLRAHDAQRAVVVLLGRTASSWSPPIGAFALPFLRASSPLASSVIVVAAVGGGGGIGGEGVGVSVICCSLLVMSGGFGVVGVCCCCCCYYWCRSVAVNVVAVPLTFITLTRRRNHMAPWILLGG